MCTRRDEKNQGLTVKTVMVQKLMMMVMIWMVVLATANAIVTMDVDVDILGGGLTSSGAPPLLSEPHDPPYPMQPYVTKSLQFHNFTNPNTTCYKFPTDSARDSAMGKEMPCQGHRTTVRPYHGTTVRRTMYDKYDV